MKKVLFLALIFASIISFSQAPQYLNYQGIARDASGTIVTSAIGIKFEILQGSASGSVVFDETNTLSPSSAGVFTAAIGGGTLGSFGPFSGINWSTGPYFIRVSIDPAGGTSYSTVGTSQLLSVPYALYAEKAGNTQTVNISGSGVTGTFPNYTITPSVLTPSTGISISGGTITNTAPNQTVNITGPNVTGAYPSYTITPGALTPSTGISINSGTITNTAPDQTVTLAAAGISSVTGTYPSYTIDVPPPTLNYNTGTNVLTLTQGTAVATTTLVGAGSNTVAMFASGIASVNPVGAGSNFTVSVQTPTFTNVGPTTITGTYPNLVINSPAASTVTAANLQINSPHSTSTLSANNYSINIAPTSITGSGVTGSYPNYTVNATPAATVVAGTNVTVGGTGPTYTVNAVPTLSLGAGVLSISGGNSVVLPVAPAQTTVHPGTNITIGGIAPNYTVNSPTYSLNFSNSINGTLTNGISSSSVVMPQPTLTLGGASNNVISAGSNSITLATYSAGNGLLLGGTFPNFSLSTTSTGTNAAWSTLGNTGTNAGANFLGTTDAQDLVFRTQNTQRMKIFNPSGFVGIGNVTTASELLQIETGGSLTAVSILSGTNTALYFGNAGNHQRGRITYDNSTDLMSFGTNGISGLMGITSAGKVGIGNVNPSEFLQLQTSTNTDLSLISPAGSLASVAFGHTGNHFMGRIQYDITNNSMNFWTNNTSGRFVIDQNGAVGIGTSAPLSNMHLRINSSGYMLIENTLGGTNPYGIRFMAPGQDWYFLANPGTGPANSLGVFDGNAGQMRMIFMPTNGFVGVGTNAPSSLFHVNGQITMTDGSQGAGKVLTSNTAGTATWKTNQVAFFCGGNPAVTTQTFNASTTSTLVFNSGASSLAYNLGGGYSVATGVFTAPVAGVYHFDAMIVCAGAPIGFITFKMRHSSGNILCEQDGFYNAVGQNWYSAHLGSTVHLNAGERVAIEYYSGTGGTSQFNHDKSSFSGHLVYAD